MKGMPLRWLLPALLVFVTQGLGQGVVQKLHDEKPGDSPLTYEVQSQLVQIYLTVTEGSRRVTDVNVSDFSISEDGLAKRIDRVDTGKVPLQVALLLDTSESMRDALAVTQEAAAYFVESLNPGDRVTLIPFNTDIRSIPQVSDDREPILHAIRSTQARGVTKLYDALLFAMKYLSGKEGRKAIVAFSDGEDTARGASLNLVLNASARYGYPIYTIGAGAGIRRDTLKRVLRQVAEINSGKTYFVDDPKELRSAFLEVAQELRSAFVLNYYTQVPFDGRWHDVNIALSNPRYRVHSRKGFYARTGGSNAVYSDPGEPARIVASSVPAWVGPDPRQAAMSAREAVKEILQPPLPSREIDPAPLRTLLPREPEPDKTPVFRVESRFVEVPVLLESLTGREIPRLSAKDFRVFEDDSIREIAYFSDDVETRRMAQLREDALQKVQAGDLTGLLAQVESDGQELLLGRFYLVLDDLMTETPAFLQAKESAAKIVREHYSRVRPLSLHFTSRSEADVLAEEGIEVLLERIRKAAPRSTQELTSNDNLISIYEAYLIERGEKQATQLAELRLASSLSVQYRNELGEVDGQDLANPEMIQSEVQNMSRQAVAANFAHCSRALDGLQAVVNAASADPGTHPKGIILVSSGFIVGRGSLRGDLAARLETIIGQAKRNGIRFYSVDAAGLAVRESIGIGASGEFLVRNPHLSSILYAHASGWQMEKQSLLSHLAGESGGRFIHNTNDLVGAVGSAIRTAGRLYYLGYISRQPSDGRFHRIRVTTSTPAVRVHARRGYYARHRYTPETLSDTGADGEDWETLLARANEARATGDMPSLARSLEQLVRRFPNEANLWYNLGVAYLKQNMASRAVESLQRAFTLSPEDKMIGTALSRAFIEEGLHDAAADTLETILRKHPQDVALLAQLGRIHEASSRTAEAHQVYRRILDLGLRIPVDLYVPLARTSLALGRKVEASLFIRDYLSLGGQPAIIDPWLQMLPPDYR